VTVARTAIALLALIGTAACTDVRAAEPFPEVPMSPPPARSHAWAYASLAAGVGLIGTSFLLTRRADDLYAEYLSATDPARIETLYDRTLTCDRLSSGALLGGEALVVLGVYLRFIRHPAGSRVQLTLAPSRCALSLRY
jgi:hypothetical protein